MRADLHIHSTASDGTWDSAQLVTAAQAAGIKVVAVTDHDSVANVAAVEKLAQAAGLKFVPGLEINTTKDRHNYHVLGYGISLDDKTLQELCDHNEALLAQKDVDSIKRLQDLGWPVNLQEFTD